MYDFSLLYIMYQNIMCFWGKNEYKMKYFIEKTHSFPDIGKWNLKLKIFHNHPLKHTLKYS